MDNLLLTFVLPQASTARDFQAAFSAFSQVTVVEDRWENLPAHDCFVTAGNSFGLMSAGIDAVVVHRFGPEIQQSVQLRIMNEYLGEQPIGSAFVLPTGASDIPWLCHAPTMRVPGDINGTDQIYLATRAALLSIYHHNRAATKPIRTVVLPSFGTGFGGVGAQESARQMAVAYKLFLEPPYPPNWDRVVAREKLICMDGDQRKVRR